MIAMLLRVAFGLAIAAYALHLVTASLDEVTTPYDPEASCLTSVCK